MVVAGNVLRIGIYFFCASASTFLQAGVSLSLSLVRQAMIAPHKLGLASACLPAVDPLYCRFCAVFTRSLPLARRTHARTQSQVDDLLRRECRTGLQGDGLPHRKADHR